MSEAMRTLDVQPRGRFKPYPAYKDSGIEWLGEIPAHWEVKRLKYVAPARVSKAQSKPDGVVYVGLEHIESWTGRLLLENQPETVDSVVASFEGGDVLFSKLRPYLGKVARPEFRGVCTSEVLPLRPLGDCSQGYLMYALLNPSYIQWLDSLTYGTKMPRVSHEQIADSFACIPPGPEQRAIATFLDRETARIDALIAKKERLIDLLQEKRTVLITRAVTKGLDPDVPMKDSGVEWLGEIPAHWEVKRIAMAAVKITNGYVGPTRDILVNEGVRYLQSLHIKDGAIDFERRPYYVAPDWSHKHSKSVLASGDVLVVQTGDIGQVAVVSNEFAGSNCHALIIIRLRENVGSGEWLATALLSDYGQHSLLWSQTGALHPHLECGHVREIRIAFPPLREQISILSRLYKDIASIDNLTSRVREAIDRLKELRTALISAAVTGKIDVREEMA